MTQERNFDRLIQGWLEAGPTKAPEGSVSAILRAVESTPQGRPSRRAPSWRAPSWQAIYNRMSAIAAIAAPSSSWPGPASG